MTPIRTRNKKRFVLELNSHSLSHFQQCGELYKKSEIDLLTQRGEYYPYKRGAGIAKYLGIWYLAKKKRYSPEKLENLEFWLGKNIKRSRYFINEKYQQDDRFDIAKRMMHYFDKYRCNDYPVISVEQGFSKVLYESSDVLFIYSGRPDLVMDYGKHFGIGPMDHKTESRESDIAPFNNQFIGYCWALNAKVGYVNYLGLQKDSKDGDVLRRKVFTFTPSQIERWKEDTIRWYRRIMQCVVSKDFIRSWRCEGKYGVCQYYKLCTSGSINEEKMKIKRDFIQLDSPYRSW